MKPRKKKVPAKTWNCKCRTNPAYILYCKVCGKAQ